MSSYSYSIEGDDLHQLREAEASTVTVDDQNMAKARVTYTGRWPQAATLALSVSRHPDFQSLIRKSFSVSRTSPCLADVSIEFEGVVAEDDEEPNVVTKYSLQGTVGTEPIETHPKFKGVVGNPGFGGFPIPGTKATNDQGAMFDENGKFLGFAVESDGKDYYDNDNTDKSGVRNYLAPGFVYNEDASYNSVAVSTIAINMNNLGNIDVPPNSNILPEVSDGRTWLLIGASIEEAGEGVSFRRSWRLSGKRGWDIDIYTD